MTEHLRRLSRALIALAALGAALAPATAQAEWRRHCCWGPGPGPWFWGPYPYYYAYPPPVYVEPPPAVIMVPQQAQPQVQQPPTWYYCAEAKAYYPYVQSCPNGWQAVPATPPSPTQPAPQSGAI